MPKSKSGLLSGMMSKLLGDTYAPEPELPYQQPPLQKGREMLCAKAPEEFTWEEAMGALRQVVDDLDHTEQILKRGGGLNRSSIFVHALSPAVRAPEVDKDLASSCWNFIHNLPKPRPSDDEATAAARSRLDRAIGGMVGMALGDGVGAPLEFLPVDDSLPPHDRERPHVYISEGGELKYNEELNSFRLRRGQWTDDCSMGLALADSLLTQEGYLGGDARLRWWQWWNEGSCNAFRFDQNYKNSVGLGGNISQSLHELHSYMGKPAHKIPPIFEKENEDAGNGSIMRLAAVPIGFNTDIGRAQNVAALQSYATHPGPDAAACCRFMTFFMIRAIHNPAPRPPKEASLEDRQAWVRAFVDGTIADFLEQNEGAKDTGMAKIALILASKAPSAKEAHWDWKQEHLPVTKTVRARKAGGNYNGYPVLPGYWGAYSMDAMSMSLWSIYYSTTFPEAIIKASNLLGDADTVAAIAGQMAGALHGYGSLYEDAGGQMMLRNMGCWDRYGEIPIRAAALFALDLPGKTDQRGRPNWATKGKGARNSQPPAQAGPAGEGAPQAGSEAVDNNNQPLKEAKAGQDVPPQWQEDAHQPEPAARSEHTRGIE